MINKIFDKKHEKDKRDEKDEKLKLYIRNFLKIYDDKISISYDNNKLSTKETNLSLKKYNDGLIRPNKLIEEYNKFIINAENFKDVMKQRKQSPITPNQKNMEGYIKD